MYRLDFGCALGVLLLAFQSLGRHWQCLKHGVLGLETTTENLRALPDTPAEDISNELLRLPPVPLRSPQQERISRPVISTLIVGEDHIDN